MIHASHTAPQHQILMRSYYGEPFRVHRTIWTNIRLVKISIQKNRSSNTYHMLRHICLQEGGLISTSGSVVNSKSKFADCGRNGRSQIYEAK